jgi:transcriptional regulator with XRE-family HTH domain
MNEYNKNIFTCTGEYDATLGQRIRQARKRERLISQGQLAELVGLSMNTINRYERGHRSPTVEEVVRIAEALDCDPCWILTGRYCSGTVSDGGLTKDMKG